MDVETQHFFLLSILLTQCDSVVVWCWKNWSTDNEVGEELTICDHDDAYYPSRRSRGMLWYTFTEEVELVLLMGVCDVTLQRGNL